MQNNIITLFGYKIFSDELNQIDSELNKKIIINTINPHSYAIAKKDDIFSAALKESDILLPDGIGIVYASSLINNINITRITGYDLLIHLILLLNKNSGKCFFMGTDTETLVKIKKRLKNECPKIKVDYYAPPYSQSFTKTENSQIIEKINSFSPDILFVSMTAPKQEKWVHKNKSLINAKMFCSIGAAFDFYAGTAKRPSQFWIDRNLEWLIRFLRSPIKYWQRNIISLPIFIKDVYKTKFKSLFQNIN